MTSGIYKICCKGKYYWGSSWNIERRFIEHRSLLKRKKHGSKKLQELYEKFGKESLSFEIVEICEIDKLGEREKFYLDLDPEKLNLWVLPFSPKGCKRINKRIFSQETKDRISRSVKINQSKNGHPRLGAILSQETKDKIAKSNRKIR